jgi:hypothetical protein
MPVKLPRPPIKPVVDLARRVLPALCPNPNVSISLPPKITFGCR